MAIINVTSTDFTLTSKYTCTTVRLTGSTSNGTTVDRIESQSTSTPTEGKQTVSFSYSSVDLSKVNMVVVQASVGGTPFGGSFKVNGEGASVSAGVLTAYLEASAISSTSASIEVEFTTYTPAHTHYSDYDSYKVLSGSSQYGRIQYKKTHNCNVALSNVTLKIYTGDDAVSRPSVPQIFIGVGDVAKRVTEMFIGVNGKAKRVTEAWIGVNGKAQKIFPTLIVGDLSPGDIVQIDEMGDGNLVEWMVMHQNYYGEKQTILMRKYCLPDSYQLNYNGGSSSNYSNPYFSKTIDNYLKNTWLLGTGYLTFQKILLETNIMVRNWSGGDLVTQARKVWLPSAVNVSPGSFTAVQSEEPNGGFAYFLNNDTTTARKAYRETNTTEAVYWWTRSTTGGTHPYCKAVGSNGDLRNDSYYSYRYLRPVINISSENFVKSVSTGVYKLII